MENQQTELWTKAIDGVEAGKSLSSGQARQLFLDVFEGDVPDSALAGLLVALKARGYRASELHGFSEAMLEVALEIPIPAGCIDIVGTGGSKAGCAAAINVSTMAAFVAAAAEVPVLKHGNRKVSSTSGSFDFLEALGVPIPETPESAAKSLEQFGIGFAYARHFHPAMRHVAKVRQELGFPTVFNLLGPLCNPGRVRRLVLGAASTETADLMAQTCAHSNYEYAMIVHGLDGIDEISLSAPTLVFHVRGGEITSEELNPEDFGFRPHSGVAKGGDARDNVRIFAEICQGKESEVSEIVMANAAAGLVVAGAAEGFSSAVELVRAKIRDGSVLNRVNSLRN